MKTNLSWSLGLIDNGHDNMRHEGATSLDSLQRYLCRKLGGDRPRTPLNAASRIKPETNAMSPSPGHRVPIYVPEA